MPVDILLGASGYQCALNKQTRQMLLGVQTLPRGKYKLTAVAGATEIDMYLASVPGKSFCFRKVPLLCSLNPNTSFICQLSRLICVPLVCVCSRTASLLSGPECCSVSAPV